MDHARQAADPEYQQIGEDDARTRRRVESVGDDYSAEKTDYRNQADVKMTPRKLRKTLMDDSAGK
jgi:hypothetical protein